MSSKNTIYVRSGHLISCLILTLIGKNNCLAEAGIQRFTVNNIDVRAFFKEPAIIREGSSVDLKCTVMKKMTHNFTLSIRDLSGRSFVISSNKTTVKYTFDRFQCRHQGSYICEVAYGLNQNGIMSTNLAIKSCHAILFNGQDSIESISSIVSPISSNQNVSFPIIAYITVPPVLFIQNVSLRDGDENDKYRFELVTSKMSSVLLTVVIEIRNISTGDYGRMNMRLYTGSNTLLKIKLTIKPEGKTSEIKFSFVEDKEERSVTLNCTAVGYPRYVAIGRRYFQGILSSSNSSGQHQIITLYHFEPDVWCSYMGTYVCNVTNYEGTAISQLLDVTKTNCGPTLCPHQRKNVTQFLSPGETAVISFCILPHRKLFNKSDIQLFLSSKCNRTAECSIPSYTADIVQSESTMYYITLHIFNISFFDFGCYNISIRNVTKFSFSFCLIERIEGRHLVLCDESLQNTTISADLRSNITFRFCVSSNTGLGSHIGINEEAYRFQNTNPDVVTSPLGNDKNETALYDNHPNKKSLYTNNLDKDSLHNVSLHKDNRHSLDMCGKHARDTSDYLTVAYNKINLTYFINITMFNLSKTDFKVYNVKLRPNLTVELEFTFTLLLNKKPPSLCKEQKSEVVIFAQILDTVSVDFCVEDPSKRYKIVNINDVSFPPGSVHNKTDVHIIEETWPKVILRITFKHVIDEDFKVYDVYLSSVDVPQTSILTFVLIQKSVTEAVPPPEFTANRVHIPTSLAEEMTFTNGQTALLECAAQQRNHDVNSSLTILDERNHVLNKTDGHSVQVYFPSLACGDANVYRCIVEDVGSKSEASTSMTLVVSNCFPEICPQELNMKTVSAFLGQNISVSFCISFVYNKRNSPYISYNRTSAFHKHWIFNDGGLHNNTLSLTIYNITMEDYNGHNFIVTINNSGFLKLMLHIEKIVDQSVNSIGVTSSREIKSLDNSLIAIPVAVICVIIIMAVVSAYIYLQRQTTAFRQYSPV